MAPTAESSDPLPIRLSPDVLIRFVLQGDVIWATMVCGEHEHELGPLDDDDSYAENIMRLAAQVLVEHPAWADEVHTSADRTHQFVRIGHWVIVARGLSSHARFAHEADARGRFAALVMVHP
jgi:hypothetical protein